MEPNQKLQNKLLNFISKNIVTMIALSFLIWLVIHGYTGHLERKNFFDNGETLYTIGKVVHYKSQGKMGKSIGYSFFLDGIKIESANDPGNPLKNSIYKDFGYDYKKMQKLVLGKRFFVKFSVEKPEYCQIYLSKPVAEDFQYVEGQTWETIPNEAIENKDIYGNDR
jgi:hypothetical protein